MAKLAFLPNMITLGSIASAATGMLYLYTGPSKFAFAIPMLCVVVSLIFDKLDGYLARRLKVSSAVGAQLDSLADLVAFGFLPALSLGRLLTLDSSLNFSIHVTVILYVCATAWRLAKFSENGMIQNRFGECFIGMPSPIAGALLMSAIALGTVWPVHPYILQAFALALAGLMNSKIPYPKRGWINYPWYIVLPCILGILWNKALS